jgi:hypothetical protein
MGLFDIIWPLFYPILAAIVSLIHIRVRNFSGSDAIGNFLMWQLAIGFGLASLISGFSHIVFADRVAESIGWPVGSPFQREVGMWDAAMGICGLLCLKFKDDFWTAIVIGPGLFVFFAGLGHVWELVMHGDNSPNNAGTVMYFDLLYPLFLAALLIWYRKKTAETGSAPS